MSIDRGNGIYTGNFGKSPPVHKNSGKASVFPTGFCAVAGYTVGTRRREGDDEFDGVEALQRLFAVWNRDGDCHRITDRIFTAVEKFFRAEARHGFFLDKMSHYA